MLDGNIEYRNERYVPGESRDCDLTVVPLCLRGDRAAIYCPPALAIGSGARLDLAPPGNRSCGFRRAAEASQPGSADEMRQPVSGVRRGQATWCGSILRPVTGWSFAAYYMAGRDGRAGFGAFDIAMQRIGARELELSGRFTGLLRSTRRSTFPWDASFPLRSLGRCSAPLGAAGRFHAGSISRQPTFCWSAAVLAAAAGLPWLMRRMPRQLARSVVACAMVVVLIGPAASAGWTHVEWTAT